MSKSPDDPDSPSLEPSGSQPKADFSRVGGSIDSSAATAPGADFSQVRSSVDSSAERSYTVEKGDNLSAISRKVYGSAGHWRSIFEANRDQLDNPDLIQPGQTLRIPGLDGDTRGAG